MQEIQEILEEDISHYDIFTVIASGVIEADLKKSNN